MKEIFAAALKLPPDARSSYLAATCGGDDELRAEVERLLDSHDRASRFLGEPPPLISDLASQTMHLEGQRIGAYEVVSRLGAGGMGEVYRARDLKLGRDVAIKILRHVFTGDPERLARFEREARVLAALTHPNIGAIYAVEDPSPGSGPVATPVLVLELIEGDTLAERIARGNRDSGVAARRGLPMAEALKIAAQIADALEAAHDKGIVHRDLKPANIKITPAGLVKVLDFGLAKAVMGDDASNPDLSHSPTISVRGTREGMILGTAAYMSPEQARGQPVDKRTDIWAFGCVVYEMLAGRVAFPGATVSDTIAAILEREPDWSGLPSATPKSIRQLLRRCLEKDARQRLRDIGEARIELLRDINVLGQIRADVGRRRLRTPAARVAMWAAAVAIAAAGALVWTQRQAAPPFSSTGTLTRLTSDSGLAIAPALSPDGRLVAYASDRAGEGNLDIWVRQVAGGDPIRLTRDAADEVDPTFTPDGTQVAFRSERDSGGVYVVSALGGEPVLLAPNGHGPRFSPDGQWLAYHTGIRGAGRQARFAFANAKVYIVRRPSGPPRQIQPGAKTATVASWSPDGRHLLIQASFETGIEADDWWVTPLEGAATKVDLSLLSQLELELPVPEAWLPGNRVVFSADSRDTRNHWAVTLSDRTWEIEQPPQRLTSGTGIEGRGSAVTAVGATRLAFSSIVENVDLWSVPLDRSGLHASIPPLRLTQDTAADHHPTLTPDGATLIWSSNRQRRRDLWARDLVTGRETNLISMPPFLLSKPVMSPDGLKLAFWRLEGDGQPSVTFVTELRRNPDGTLRAAEPSELPKVAEEGSGWPWSWSSNGQRLWYDPARWPRLASNHLYDIATRSILAPFGHPQHDLAHVNLSPDGRWLAFLEPLSDDTGRLVVAPIVGGTEPAGPSDWIQIASSDRSLSWNAWSPAGDVLYYESNRDGYVCVWAQRLARDTMRLVGPPVAIHHAHNARLSIGMIGPNQRGLAVAGDKVVFNMSEMTGSIWMAEFDDGGTQSP